MYTLNCRTAIQDQRDYCPNIILYDIPNEDFSLLIKTTQHATQHHKPMYLDILTSQYCQDYLKNQFLYKNIITLKAE